MRDLIQRPSHETHIVSQMRKLSPREEVGLSGEVRALSAPPHSLSGTVGSPGITMEV